MIIKITFHLEFILNISKIISFRSEKIEVKFRQSIVLYLDLRFFIIIFSILVYKSNSLLCCKPKIIVYSSINRQNLVFSNGFNFLPNLPKKKIFRQTSPNYRPFLLAHQASCFLNFLQPQIHDPTHSLDLV